MNYTLSDAVFSPGKRYRYALWRIWEEEKGIATFICLNPSTADATKDDPTVRRCINFAKSWGHGGFCMANLFAYRATKPKDLKNAGYPTGTENDDWLKTLQLGSKIIVAAWGTLGNYKGRDQHVKKMIPGLHYLELSKKGFPKHPLYLKGDLKPIPWS